MAFPRLLADIGGTHARFCIEVAAQQFLQIHVLRCAEHDSLEAAIRAYLQQVKGTADSPLVASIRVAAIAIANPVTGDHVAMTNHHWQFSQRATQDALGLDYFAVHNDFSALAMALPTLPDSELQPLGGPARAPITTQTLGLIGAGTGLGVSGLVHAAGRWQALQSEGGHVSFAPADAQEMAVLQILWQQHRHVSAERLLSGPGLCTLYAALATLQGTPIADDAHISPADVVQRAHEGEALALQTLDSFSAMLGSMASNLAVTLGSWGGVYIGGGVVPKLGSLFNVALFRQRFEHKGRFRRLLEQVPTTLITAPYPAFYGVSALLNLTA